MFAGITNHERKVAPKPSCKYWARNIFTLFFGSVGYSQLVDRS